MKKFIIFFALIMVLLVPNTVFGAEGTIECTAVVSERRVNISGQITNVAESVPVTLRVGAIDEIFYLGQQMTEGVVTAAKLAKDIEAAKALIETLKGNRNAQQEDVLARQEECAAIEEENKAILAEMEQIRSNIENTKGETAVLAKDIEEKQLAYEQGVGKLKEKQKLKLRKS